LGDIQTPQISLDEILNYISEADKPCIIAIDEFQQIGEYAEKMWKRFYGRRSSNATELSLFLPAVSGT